MAKIARKNFKLFGTDGDSNDFTEFGSTVAGSTVRTKNIDTIQALPAWTTGWPLALVAANHAPIMEDMNALCYVFAYMLANLFQDGVPAWDAGTTYYTGSIVRRDGSSDMYASTQDDNVGNAVPTTKASNSFWSYIRTGPPTGSIIAFAGPSLNVPGDFLPCNGIAISRSAFPDLFAAIGTTWGAGDGVTTFNIPNLNERMIVGIGSDPGFSLGTSGGQLTHTHTQASHSHTVDAHHHVLPDLTFTLQNTGAGVPAITIDGTLVQSNTTPGSKLQTNPTRGGVGSAAPNVTNTTITQSGLVTSDASPGTDSVAPAINQSDFYPQYAAMIWMIKT